MTYIADLKTRVSQLSAENEHLQSLVDTFLTGDIPDGATMTHFIFAKYGRKRLEELQEQKSIPALLRSE